MEIAEYIKPIRQKIIFGRILGLNVGNHKMVMLPILCTKPDQPIAIHHV